jgi:hypothetical protein
MKFLVYKINVLSKLVSAEVSGVDAFVELMEVGESGGEAFHLNIIETTNTKLHNQLVGGVLYVQEIDVYSAQKILQKIVDETGAKSWQELIAAIPQEIKWV